MVARLTLTLLLPHPAFSKASFSRCVVSWGSVQQGDTLPRDNLPRDTWFRAASSKVGSAHVPQNRRVKEKMRQKKKYQVCEGKTLSGKKEHPL